MIKNVTAALLLLLPCASYAQQREHMNDSIVSRVILIGDAGELTADKHHPVVEAVERNIDLNDRTTVVFLGDNLYRHGLPDDQYSYYKEAKAVLDSQANIADHFKGMVYFIPGNHDWINGAAGGYSAIIREQQYLDGLGKKNLKYYPKDGCPGPIEVNITKDVVMIMMDSQWWIHKYDKPGIESDCPYKTKEDVISEIKDIISQNQKKLIIFADHHPFRTNGIHGGYYTIKQHIFPLTDIKKNLYIPLPALGSIYPISRSVFGTPQDLQHPTYASMISQVEEVLKSHPNVIHVAGHEHALEWISDSNSHYILSGAGCKTTRVSKSRHSKFEASKIGFATLDIYENKDVRCTFYGVTRDSMSMLYTDKVLNYTPIPDTAVSEVVLPTNSYKDTVTVAASNKYGHPKGFRRFVLGDNYRDEWTEPVNLKVFWLRTQDGGYKIVGSGGGFQTKSIHLKDKDGVEWNMRTIDKDPRKVLPPAMRSTFAKDVVQDMISAAHPYAPLTVSYMADAAGIIAAKPQYFYVPNDTAFGSYRSTFANKVVMLEPRDATADHSDTKSTAKVINKLIGDNDHFVNQEAVLQARLLDFTIGDWDRHFDQWRWAVDDTGKGKLYYPIPRDRDQAFFKSDGALMWYATKRILPWMNGFKLHYKKIKWLAYSPRNFDRIFMNGLGEQQWTEGIKRFQEAENDSVINTAIRRMPPEISALKGDVIAQSLKNRRDELTKGGMRYYRFLSKEVNVLGSNKDEYFTVKKVDTGGILVQIHAKEHDTAMLMYSRVFDPKVTKEIRLYGFNGNDNFDIDDEVRTKMRIRMIGGKGNDTFNVKGIARSHVYDVSTELNPVLAHRHTDISKSSNPNINDYSTDAFTYNYVRLPSLNAGYNPEDGVLVGLGFIHRSYGWRKTPFKTEHHFTTLYSPAYAAFQAKYRGTFIGVHKGYDLLVNADLQTPALKNFFGFGNNTVKENGNTVKYYRTRYKFASGDLLAQQRLFGNGVLKLAAGPTVYHYWNNHERNDGHVLENPQYIGLDSNSVYNTKTYLGGKLIADINNLNNPLFPTRGISWKTTFTAMGGMNGNSKPITDLHTDMNVYASLSEKARLVAVLRLGGGHIFSKDFEYFQAEAVGADNYLRGFRKSRFAGRSMFYNSIELRCKLVDVQSYIIPGSFGVIGFNDVARVWMDGESSKKWHNASGGGLYYIPFNLVIISATVAYSKEETLFNLTLGTKLNLTF